MDFSLVKAYVNKGEVNSLACIEPDMLEEHLTLQVNQLVDGMAGEITKSQWKEEQMSDPEIGPVLKLVLKGEHLQYKIQKTDLIIQV